MRDRFDRTIDYLRVSVTDRCNLRCRYCMPPGGVQLIRHEDVLNYEEIAAFVRQAVAMGVRKVRLTGGEPLVRRGVVTLVAMLAEIDGIEDLAMTTNGLLLGRFAADLHAAGLGRINVSLDAIDPARYARITRGGDVREALAGIEAAMAVGLEPIKINCVVERSSDEPDARDVAAFARDQGLAVRFIRRMELPSGRFHPVEGGEGGRCEQCNRLRLSSDGWVRPCLLSDGRFSVRELGAAEAIRRAVEAKPACGTVSETNRMYAVGG